MLHDYIWRVFPAVRLAYVFERFPTFTQTFCVREVGELDAQGVRASLFSIRIPSDEPPQDFPVALGERTVYLPPEDELTALARRLQGERKLPRPLRRTLEAWTSKRDKHRVYEAAWLGPRLRKAGVRHVHVHFAGIAARTAYWLKRFYGITYSFTGHANDIFCEEEPLPVTREDLVREAAMVVTVSDFSAHALQITYPGEAHKIHRVYNGIDTRRWIAGDRERAPLIVSVGRYIEKKGFADLIAACAVLRDRGMNFRCQIIGEGPLEESLRAQVQAANLGELVELTGPKSQDAILAILQSAMIFALPCVKEQDGGMDNLPTVIAEAMACGLPVVSTPVAGVPEMIVNGVTGSIVPEADPSALANALAHWLEQSAAARAAGEAGRKRAVEVFDLRVTTRQVKHLLVAQGRVLPGLRALRHDSALAKSWITGKTAI